MIIMLKKGLFIITIMVAFIFGGLVAKTTTIDTEEYNAEMVSVSSYYNDPIANGMKTLEVGKVSFVTKTNEAVKAIIDNGTTKINVKLAINEFKI